MGKKDSHRAAERDGNSDRKRDSDRLCHFPLSVSGPQNWPRKVVANILLPKMAVIIVVAFNS